MRTATADVLEEDPQCSAPVIPGHDVIVARAFEVLQKPEHPLESEVLETQLADRPPRLSRHEQDKQAGVGF
jgi:hypothetical protein